jgi:hypothetical protein
VTHHFGCPPCWATSPIDLTKLAERKTRRALSHGFGADPEGGLLHLAKTARSHLPVIGDGGCGPRYEVMGRWDWDV